MSNEINASEAEKKLMEQQLGRWGKVIFIKQNAYCGTVENREFSAGDIQKINETIGENWQLKPLSPE